MSSFKQLLILLVVTTSILGITGLAFAQDNFSTQNQLPKAQPAAAAKNVVEATVTGQNVSLTDELMKMGADAQCAHFGPMYVLRVSKVIVDGKVQDDMQGWVLHYLPTKNSLDMLNRDGSATVTVTGKIYVDERMLEVSSFTAANAPAAAAEAKAITWHQSLPEAFAEAQQRNTLIVVDCYADWCHWCKQLDADTLSNPTVQTRLRDFTLARINTDQQPAVAQRYGVSGLPTTLVLNAQGTVVLNHSGYMSPDEYLNMLAQAKSR